MLNPILSFTATRRMRSFRTILIVTAVAVSLPALYFAFVQLRKANQVKEKIAQEKRKLTRIE